MPGVRWMRFTGGTKTTTAVGAALLAVGLPTVGYGVLRGDLPTSLGGTCLVATALVLIALALIRAWITNVAAERRELAEARREADAERRKHFAGQAALECEMTRLNRDMAAERARITHMLITERAAARAALEEERLQITTEAFRTGVEMERAGMLKPDAPLPANLIPFPGQGRAPERERSREHGVVGP
jgi:hypothetical protein